MVHLWSISCPVFLVRAYKQLKTDSFVISTVRYAHYSIINVSLFSQFVRVIYFYSWPSTSEDDGMYQVEKIGQKW